MPRERGREKENSPCSGHRRRGLKDGESTKTSRRKREGKKRLGLAKKRKASLASEKGERVSVAHATRQAEAKERVVGGKGRKPPRLSPKGAGGGEKKKRERWLLRAEKKKIGGQEEGGGEKMVSIRQKGRKKDTESSLRLPPRLTKKKKVLEEGRGGGHDSCLPARKGGKKKKTCAFLDSLVPRRKKGEVGKGGGKKAIYLLAEGKEKEASSKALGDDRPKQTGEKKSECFSPFTSRRRGRGKKGKGTCATLRSLE